MPLGELAFIFGTSLGVGFSGAVTPGPLLSFTVSEAARRGFRAGPQMVLGHALLELALVGGLWLGLARLLSNALALAVIGAVGGAALIAFGGLMVRSVLGDRLSVHASGAAPWARLHPVGVGVVASITNPFWTLWWATIGLAYVTRATQLGFAGAASFYTGHILSDLLWFGGIAFGVARGRRFISQQVYRGVIGACGVFLVGLGVYFVFSSGIALAA